MLTLLSPAGLWALAALSIPLALHLWRRPPQTIRLGSLRFLARVSRRIPRDLRWHEQLLLAARLLLLALLALMLARPHWRPASEDRPQRWALIDPTGTPEGESLARLRAVQAAGYETHQLASGFPRGTPAEHAGAPAPDLWSWLREADAGLPAGSALAVFTPGRLASLRGHRPFLPHCRVEWVMTPENVGPAPIAPLSGGAAPLHVLVLHDASRAEDARYLAAAVRAAGQISGSNVALTEGNATQSGVAAVRPADWVFWLSAQPPPDDLASQATNLFSDVAGNETGQDAAPSWILPQPDVNGAAALAPPVRLWQRVIAPARSRDAVIWTDGFGQPLLTQSSQGSHRQWRFFSRFHPDWTDLPRTTALPAWLRGVLLPLTNAPLLADPAADHRLADPAQLPAAASSPMSESGALPLRRDTPGLQGWCWLLAAILFGIERGLSHWRRPDSVPEPALSLEQPEPELAR
jgi:hypothetical protein